MGTVCILVSRSSYPWLIAIAARRMKVSGEQFEDRIVEVHWDSTVEGWRMMRFRDDKPAGNHAKTVESIIQSIRDGVEKETVRDRQLSRYDLILTTPSPSCSKNAGPSERPGKLGKIGSHYHHPSTPARDHPASLPLLPNRGPYPVLTFNLHNRTRIPTCKCGIRSRLPSRTLRWTYRMRLHKRNHR